MTMTAEITRADTTGAPWDSTWADRFGRIGEVTGAHFPDSPTRHGTAESGIITNAEDHHPPRAHPGPHRNASFPRCISSAEPITFKDAQCRLGIRGWTLYEWIRIGRLQTVEVDPSQDRVDRRHRRMIIIPPSVRIIPPAPEERHRLPELHRLIDQIRPRYPADTIAGLVAIVAAAEKRLAVASRFVDIIREAVSEAAAAMPRVSGASPAAPPS